MVGIYKITNKVNGKVYVGQSIDIIDRWKQHYYKAFNSKEVAFNSAIHSAFRKYGIENFELEVIEECSAEELDEKEKFWVKEFNSLSPNGYNILSGGQFSRGEPRVCKKCGGTISKGTKTGLCINCYKEFLKDTIPTKEELYNILIENKGNFSKVGRLYNVTDNAVRKWCKGYNLPFHSSDYK